MTTKLLDSYRKERKRVTNYISKLRREGFTVDISIGRPNKNPTKEDVEAMRSLTPAVIKEYAYAIDEIGAIYEVDEVRRLKREYKRAGGEDRARLDRIENVFTSMVLHVAPRRFEVVMSWFNQSSTRFGREAFLNAIDLGMSDGILLTPEIAYSDDLLSVWLGSFLNYFNEYESRKNEYEKIIESVI